jgi:hypothetical protein
MYNSLVIVYGFEDDCYNVLNNNIITCKSINLTEKQVYCNIIIEEPNLLKIIKIIKIFKQKFNFKLKEMDKFAFSKNKIAKWQLALINKKKLKSIIFNKNNLEKKVLFNIDY